MRRSAATSAVPRGLHSHTTLETTDIDKALALYRDVLGLSTAQQVPKAGLMHASNGHIAAIIQMPKISAQPYWNYYARAVPRELVDVLHGASRHCANNTRSGKSPIRKSNGGTASTRTALLSPIGTAIGGASEELDGPFGRAQLPDVAGTSVLPPRPHYLRDTRVGRYCEDRSVLSRCPRAGRRVG